MKNAERYLNDTFLVLNGDIFTDLDIAAMINYHRERKAKVTIALTPVEDPISYGLVETNTLGRVTRFLEKPKPSQVTTNMINAGIYVLELDVLNQIPPQVNFSFEHELFPLLLDRSESIYAYPSSTYWIDIGTPEKYLQVNKDLLNGESSQYAPPLPREVVIGGQSHIHPTAQIKGAVMIGDNCTIEQNVKLIGPVVIGSGCQILSQAVVEDSIIWHNVQIGTGVTVKGSIVADNCCLNANSNIEDSVLGDNVTVVRGYKLEPGSKIWPGKTAEHP
ncbi:UTP--glucose-1-phosphate uridylyltransferase [subsurface metagenome]